MGGMELRALTWNLFHGRDDPPDARLHTWRSRLLRTTERNATHLQVNRDLLDEFATVLSAADWDVALLQECPPRWADPLAEATGAAAHQALTSRNRFASLRSRLARVNPDLIASNEGGSNLTLVRGEITERRELEVTPGPFPERRVMAFTRGSPARFGAELCVGNLHASAGASRRMRAESEVLQAANIACLWGATLPLVFGGDLNLRPRDTDVFAKLDLQNGLRPVTGPDSLDHLLGAGLDPVEQPRPWAPERREVRAGGLAIRLSDHAPVEATFVPRAIDRDRPGLEVG
jgi:endonuclease/exonuclease/phosphatase family metal-dependent hydrolase